MIESPARSTYTVTRQHEGLHPHLQRLTRVLPGAISIFLISSIFWGYALIPDVIATFILAFDAYWLWKSWTIGYHAAKGVGLIRATLRSSARREYARLVAEGVPVLPWEAVKHIVIVPCYRESASKMRATLRAMASAVMARDVVIPVLAMEEAEEGSEAKALALAAEFCNRFYDILVTVHPSGLPGEVRGKSSNENWAARRAYEHYVVELGLDPDYLTVTSCDADTVFHRRYFERLTFEFATDPKRYRRFWQAPILFYNNIWQVPGPLRVPNALSGLIQLGRLSRTRLVAFPQSTYSLSMRMAHEVGYWDPDVIPEDWHMFVKCFYRLGGNVDIRPIFLPLGNDGALSTTTLRTFVNHYFQVQRWGWGVADGAYILQQVMTQSRISLRRRLLRFWYFIDNHISWSTQWFFLTLGGFVPWVMGMFTAQTVAPSWFYVNELIGDTFLPDMLTLTTLIMTPCLVPYVILIVLDTRLRPRAPAGVSRRARFLAFGWWAALSPITFFSSTLPALHAQLRLLLGKRMEYRVTEKV